MALAFIVNRLKALFMCLLAMTKHALCCFRRRRRGSGIMVPLTGVKVVSVTRETKEDGTSQDLQSWNLWEEMPRSGNIKDSQQNQVQQHIEFYRQQAGRRTSETEETQQPDFFEDMEPEITEQPKVIISENENTSAWSESVSTRLSLSVDPMILNTTDLETWEDTPCWEDQAQEDWDSQAALKDKRHLERQRRLAQQHQKRLEREQFKISKQNTLGARLS